MKRIATDDLALSLRKAAPTGPASSNAPTLGTILKTLRMRMRLTLKEMSSATGIPLSTLSKVEHDRLTLTYEKLQQLSQRLKIPMSDLFAENDQGSTAKVTARRSIGRVEDAVRITTPNYDHYYLCTELRQKRMIPILTRIRATTVEQFGDLVRHQGEELIHVLEGRIEVHTEFYDPVIIEKGETLYLDSTMGHAYLAAQGCDEALVLGVCSSADEGLMDKLIKGHQAEGQT